MLSTKVDLPLGRRIAPYRQTQLQGLENFDSRGPMGLGEKLGHSGQGQHKGIPTGKGGKKVVCPQV